jgi:hypothetical protein
MLTALWRRLVRLAPLLLKEESCVKLSSRPLLDLVPSVRYFVPLRLSDLVLKLFYPYYRGYPTISGIAPPDHAKHTTANGFVSINTL